MASVTETLPIRNPFGRRAYGAHRTMSPQVKARNVAASIAAREQEGRSWSFADYGLTPDSDQAQRVRTLLQGVA